MNMIKQAAFDLHNPSIEKWKKTGKPVIGYTCSQVPVELFYAGGILPVRLRGVGVQGLDIADAYYGPFICSFPKAILQSMADENLAHLDGAVIADGCDSMRRLDECWRKAGQDYPHMNLPFFHYVNVPRKTVEHARKWFIEEMEKLTQMLESHFSLTISNEKIVNAIRAYNKSRNLVKKLEHLRQSVPSKLLGSTSFCFSLAFQSMPPESFQGQLSEFLDNVPVIPENFSAKRILISGSAFDDIHLIQTIEDADAHVVGENVCFGPLHQQDLISEKLDPYDALADHYLLNCPCPRMFGRFDYRLNLLKQTIELTKTDGVIFQNIRFCDLHASENSLLERELEKQGIPCIRLEREYGSETDTGRLRMRIDAFIERLSA